MARNFAARWDKDPRAVELVLRQTSRIVRMDNGVLIVETGPGWVCANAGIDESNSLDDNKCNSAARGRRRLRRSDACRIKTAQRRGSRGSNHRHFWTSVARWPDRGLYRNRRYWDPMLDLRGTADLGGRELHHTVIAIADQIAAAAGLDDAKAGRDSGRPWYAAISTTSRLPEAPRALIRPAASDLFR